MNKLRHQLRCELARLSAASALILAGLAAPAAAQQPDVAASAVEEIIVTARRRDETLIAVPVTVSAATEEQLRARGVTNLDGLARTIPQLIMTESSSSAQGGAIALRGIGAGDGNAFGDQAVAFNVDGVQVARSTPRRLASFDVGVVQVLKGPQALYFGKNSPAGIIMIRSNDPGSKFEAGLEGSYEFKAREWRTTGFVSTPLTDSLGFRLAAVASGMRGYVRNVASAGSVAAGTNVYEPADRIGPGDREFGLRGTLKFENGGPLTARLKVTYGRLKTDGITSAAQRVDCGRPDGLPQLGGPDDCRANGTNVRADLGPRFGAGGINTVTGAPISGFHYYRDGRPYFLQKQLLAGLELKYKLSDVLTLASTSGYYKANTNYSDNFTLTDTAFPFNPAAGAAGFGGSTAAAFDLDIEEYSEELRLTSEFDGIFNFMLGGYYQDQRVSFGNAAAVNALNPIALFPPLVFIQKGKASSVFGSVSVKPIETIEISGGARYSHERKKLEAFRLVTGAIAGVPFFPGTEIPLAVPVKKFNNVSPEVTISWRPTNQLTVFGGWKRGFISGGFNSSGTGTGVAILPDRSYGQEVVEGFEAGIKTALLDNSLRLNLSAFNYKVKGLQVFSTNAQTGAQTANNAAGARSKGIEFDATWKTPIEGLTLNGGASYNKAYYTQFLTSPCYGGQTFALGCNLGPNAVLAGAIANGFNPASGAAFPAGGAFLNQDLSGEQLVRAPKWGIVLGGDYSVAVGENKIGVSVNGNYSSSYFADPLNSPGSRQGSFWLLDASLRYELANGIELALIGRNLTNKYIFGRSTDIPFSGFGTGTNNPAAFRSDTSAVVGRPRQITIRAAYRF